MTCLWCRQSVRPRGGLNANFCCQRCQYRFYATGHQTAEDMERSAKIRADSAAQRTEEAERRKLETLIRTAEAGIAVLAERRKKRRQKIALLIVGWVVAAFILAL